MHFALETDILDGCLQSMAKTTC